MATDKRARDKGEQREEEEEVAKAKRGRVEDGSVSPKSCTIYIVANKLSSGHLKHLKTVAGRKHFPIVEEYG